MLIVNISYRHTKKDQQRVSASVGLPPSAIQIGTSIYCLPYTSISRIVESERLVVGYLQLIFIQGVLLY